MGRTRRATWGRAAALGSAVILGAAALASAVGDDDSGTGPVARPPAVLLVSSADPDAIGFDAGVVGGLSRTPRNCVGLADGAGTVRAVLWGSGLEVTEGETGYTILDAAGSPLAREGEQVSVAGGYVAVSPELAPQFEGCAEPGDSVAVVGSDVAVVAGH